MNRISAKLTSYFFISVLIMETTLMLYLHQNIIHSRIDEEFSRLTATGSNHRDVLTEYYSDTTMKHIVLMETDGEREVLITDRQGTIIESSVGNNDALTKYVPRIEKPLQDEILVSDWKDSPYIISIHPYEVNAEQAGYVIMFQSTKSVEQLVAKLNMHFGMAGITSIVVIFLIYAILSKFLTRPLIRMKEATEKLSKGDFDVSLPFIGKDELGELSVSIQKLADDLERLKTERNEFLASVAHELSTPLTYLIGYSKVAMRQSLNEQERTHYLAIIIEESNRMKELVKNLLDLAKLDENMYTVTKDNYSARIFLDNIFHLVKPSFDLKNIRLDFTYDSELQIYADSLRLEQVILNLLDNALKYSNEHSTVTLEAFKKEETTVIKITDEGIGISKEDIELIFEKLYRVEKSRSRAYGGSGIGLAVVKELVDAHGGSVEVISDVGKGSTFIVKI